MLSDSWKACGVQWECSRRLRLAVAWNGVDVLLKG